MCMRASACTVAESTVPLLPIPCDLSMCHMLQAVLHALSEQARKILALERDTTEHASTRALASVVSAALDAVSSKHLQDIACDGHQGETAQKWRNAMGSDLLTDKVCTLLQLLEEHNSVAGKSLSKVCCTRARQSSHWAF